MYGKTVRTGQHYILQRRYLVLMERRGRDPSYESNQGQSLVEADDGVCSLCLSSRLSEKEEGLRTAHLCLAEIPTTRSPASLSCFVICESLGRDRDLGHPRSFLPDRQGGWRCSALGYLISSQPPEQWSLQMSLGKPGLYWSLGSQASCSAKGNTGSSRVSLS